MEEDESELEDDVLFGTLARGGGGGGGGVDEGAEEADEAEAERQEEV